MSVKRRRPKKPNRGFQPRPTFGVSTIGALRSQVHRPDTHPYAVDPGVERVCRRNSLRRAILKPGSLTLTKRTASRRPTTICPPTNSAPSSIRRRIGRRSIRPSTSCRRPMPCPAGGNFHRRSGGQRSRLSSPAISRAGRNATARFRRVRW